MSVQVWVVAMVVAACAVAAVWQLMPARWRAHVAAQLAQAPMPAPVRNYLLKSQTASGCGGCGGGCKPPQTSATKGFAPIVLYRPKR